MTRKGVTLRLLWLEYKQANPDGYHYSQFCFRYQQWRGTQELSFHQNHKAGEKLFVDYAGQTIPVTDPITGQIDGAYLFLATLGASNYTFAWASLSLDLASWIDANVRALGFFEGVPEMIVPDNLKTGIKKPCYYEPELNPTYYRFACHYNTVIIPTRVAKPRDKAKVEAAVLTAERWIMAGSRRSLYETLDRPALKPLPSTPYVYAECKKVRANIDYHIEVDHHFYSVPCELRKKQLEAWLTANTVEIMFKNQRVASHGRSYEKYQYTTLPEHMPESHRKYLEWSPSRIMEWAGKNGPSTRDLVTCIMESRKHPEQGFRACLGIMRLTKQYPAERVEAACARALRLKAYSYKSVESILKTNLDTQELPESLPSKMIIHDNIRGQEYYRQEEAHV